MSQARPSAPGRMQGTALGVCVALVAMFAGLSFSAALTKSATFDEPFHALAGWIKLHLHEFQMDYESLPLATGWSALLNPRTSLQFDEKRDDWTKLADNPYRGFNLATNTLYRTRGNDGAAFINRGRFMMLLLGVGLGALVIAWAWKIGGPLASVAGATLFCLDPNMIGHASLVKTDVAVAFAMAGTIFMAWSVGKRITGKNALLLSLVMAAAMNTKFSSVLLWPLVTLLLGIRAVMGAEWIVMNRTMSRVRDKLLAAGALILCAGVMTVIVTWAAHGFRFGPSPDPSVTIRTESYRYELILHRYREQFPGLGAASAMTQPANSVLGMLDRSIDQAQQALDGCPEPVEIRSRLQEFIDRARITRTEAQNAPQRAGRALEAAEYQLAFVRFFALQPVDPPDLMVSIGHLMLKYRVMPSAWINGLMVQYSRSKLLDSYLLGEVRHSGTWYFFPLAMLVKSPVSEVIALVAAAAIGMWLMRVNWPRRREWCWTAWCVLVPPVAFMGMAMASNLNIGLRHVFPVYPFMYVAAGVALAAVIQRWGRTGGWLAGLLGVMLLAETTFAWPDYVAHFNVVARRWPGEFVLLGDSNLDWGQDLPALARWQREHPEAPIALAYFGMAEPVFYGIKGIALPAWPPPAGLTDTHVLAISVTHLQGIIDSRYTGYRSLGTPTQALGGTIYIYDLRK